MKPPRRIARISLITRPCPRNSRPRPTQPLVYLCPNSHHGIPPHHHQQQQQLRTLFGGRNRDRPSRPFDNLNVDRLQNEAYEYHAKRRTFLLAGAIAGSIATMYTAYLLALSLQKPRKQMDASGLPGASAFTSSSSSETGGPRKTLVHDAEGRELVPTGNGVVEAFPRNVRVGGAGETAGREGEGDGEAETGPIDYTLVGLGMRSVSFLGINVYLVGYYVATADMDALAARLVREINPIATALVPSERGELRRRLLDPVEGTRIWEEALRDVRASGGLRSAFRVVPVRDTDFGHLRDAFVRTVTKFGQVQKLQNDESLGVAVKELRALLSRGKAAKRSEIFMVRDGEGRLSFLFDDGKKAGQGRQMMGKVDDERVSRAIWMNYLAGKNVASEPARRNIVEGIMEFVERPVGSVAAQVV